MLKVAKSVNATAAWCIKGPTKMMNLSAEKIGEKDSFEEARNVINNP